MRGYYIYQPPHTDDPAEAVVVTDGFSWLALGSPTIWSIRYKVWELVILNLMFPLVLASFMPTEYTAAIVLVVWHVSFAVMAGNLRSKFLEWRAYDLKGYIPKASNADAAFVEWVYAR